jgi:hypothetical protein
MDFSSDIDKPLALNGKVIDGITKVPYAIRFCLGESLERMTALLNFFAFAMCMLVASVLLSAILI